MTLDDFLDFLGAHGVAYKTIEKSIILSDCPSCGTAKDKVWLFKDRRDEGGPFFGQCMKCSEKTNSYAYLLAAGVEKSDIDALHARAVESLNLRMMPALNLFGGREEVEKEEPARVEPIDISAFIKIPEIPKHPASLYAIKRGWTDAQTNEILIDYFSAAVVFIIRDKGEPVGFQKRFLNPFDPKMKTMSSRGFQKSRFVVEYPNDGDICVCEGPFTALSAYHFGYHAVCTFGSNVGALQLDRIGELAKTTGKSVAIAFDLDDAGRKGYLRIRSAMCERGICTYRVKPEYGNDINDSWQAGKGVVVIPAEDTDSVLDAINLPFRGFL